ncbi:MAG: hypothetical protein RLZZ350_667 [Verrucomicrobiota bacterium]|jgi:extracellular factor (EF) 3-hydroxypalmitic acid methyl ester biosynthesis protein
MSADKNAANSQFKDSRVLFKTSGDAAGEGGILKLTRFAVVFENCNPAVVLRLSEALGSFKIVVSGREVYVGKGTVKNVLPTGAAAVSCEVTLDETCWRDVSLAAANGHFAEQLGDEYKNFLGEWEKLCRLSPEYKLALADMQLYFTELRLWLDQLEAGLRSVPAELWPGIEAKTLKELAEVVIPTVNELFDHFEVVAHNVPEELQGAHQQFMRRQLHSLVLAAPFAWRTYHKPLGYAGDYEMVNMILRDAPEGKTLFGKILHLWFVRQGPAIAHRNRINYLIKKITEETVRRASDRKDCSVMNLACGPASEVVRYVGECHIADRTAFTLLDFNDETLQHTQATVMRAAAGNDFTKYTQLVRCIRKNIPELIKESLRPGESVAEGKYDLIYCAGLFDYLSDQVCASILETMYRWLAPGGLLVATNVEPSNPMRQGMGHLLDWHLVYRTGAQLKALSPAAATEENIRVIADETGVNVFLEVRKPGYD